MTAKILPFILCLILSQSCVENYEFIIDKNLKDTANFPVGVATQSYYLQNGEYADVVNSEFNSLTAEWEMKQNITAYDENLYNWEQADSIVAYGIRNGLRIHGHALLWHNAVPSWVDYFQGSDTEFEAMIKDYIQTVVLRYKGKIASWDVVNEAFEDSGSDWRNTIFRERMGDDYIEKCFVWAREADEDVLLFYNDFNLAYSESKMDAVIEMVENFKTRNIPIDGVGMQMHVGYNYPSNRKIENAVEKLVATGVKIHFSEVDIRTNILGGSNSLSNRRANQQAEKMQAITEIYNKIPADQQFGITFWGLRDNESWLLSHYGNPEWALLFDEDYQRKVAHQGFLRSVE